MSRSIKILALLFLVCANIFLLAYLGLRKSTVAVESEAAQREIDKFPAVELVSDLRTLISPVLPGPTMNEF
jgi:hypothetical protein